MLNVLSTILLGAHLSGAPPLVPVAEEMPTFDFMPSCRAAAGHTTAALEGCVRDEENARTQLASVWGRFAIGDRSNCLQETMRFQPSYVELLTCLQMARDARKLQKE
jgi:hypothetical protein